ncbi:hypothetical protein LY13_005104 [Prauserella aidingensis]|uniref:hypothetical protein n=1 Tax=Prauserella aidingensis TaxID=387890 RepID=UPI0020A356A9|nr:hypothetical protein [Prauserella aidingensis]MCP2256313.1 hypothetical protein [Prauserella aidingensis]
MTNTATSEPALAETLAVLREHFGTNEFVTRCADGTHGPVAKTAAEDALATALEHAFLDDAERVADLIVANAASEERLRQLDARLAECRRVLRRSAGPRGAA